MAAPAATVATIQSTREHWELACLLACLRQLSVHAP